MFFPFQLKARMAKEHETMESAFLQGQKLLPEELTEEQRELIAAEGILLPLSVLFVSIIVFIHPFYPPKDHCISDIHYFVLILEYMAEEDLDFYIKEDRDEEESHTRKSAMLMQQEIRMMLQKEFGGGEALEPETIKNLLLQVMID